MKFEQFIKEIRKKGFTIGAMNEYHQGLPYNRILLYCIINNNENLAFRDEGIHEFVFDRLVDKIQS